MKGPTDFGRIYLHRDPVDFRMWVDGLLAIVTAQMQLDPYKPYLFLFTNRRRDRIKALYWDKTGFAVWYKRLEKEKFAWPRKADGIAVELTLQQLSWLLDGYDFTKLVPHQPLTFSSSF